MALHKWVMVVALMVEVARYLLSPPFGALEV